MAPALVVPPEAPSPLPHPRSLPLPLTDEVAVAILHRRARSALPIRVVRATLIFQLPVVPAGAERSRSTATPRPSDSVQVDRTHRGASPRTVNLPQVDGTTSYAQFTYFQQSMPIPRINIFSTVQLLILHDITYYLINDVQTITVLDMHELHKRCTHVPNCIHIIQNC